MPKSFFTRLCRSRHGATRKARGSHLSQNAIQPLERAIEVQLDPARGGSYRLAAVLCAPSFNEAHSDGAHPRQLVDGLETLAHGLGE